jgi:diguanylate cyclase (GGDEF)-like protein
VSFRLRLTLFFVLIVVLPMVALAVLVSEIAADSAEGKVDARLDAGLRTATSLYGEAQADSRRAAEGIAAGIGGDPAAIAALQSGGQAALVELAERLAAEHRVEALRLTSSGGAAVTTGNPEAVAPAAVSLVAPGDDSVGSVSATRTDAEELVDRVETTTGMDAALIGRRKTISSPFEIEAGSLPTSGASDDLESGDQQLRVAATEPLGSEQLRIALFAPAATEGFFGSRPRVAIALIGFFAIALIAVLVIFRSLQGYVREMLGAARRIGEGDFSEQVPVSGGDEMAGLASEFNRMSDRLSEQMDQLRRQRVELERSVRRVGEAFASGLDRQALLAILVETAVGTCEAEYGLVALSGHTGAEAEAGEPRPALRRVALEAEQRALVEPDPVELERDGTFALASSIGRIGASETAVGAMTVARHDRPFTKNEREVFLYLLTQASASVENVALHELVSEQAVTDDLTGLANKRAFRGVMDKEAARARRFGHELSLLILDIDNFKQVNDVYGHPQGDEVLRTVGRILNAESRGIDAPARYGGEEFAVFLPETGPDGALEAGERIRSAIAEAKIPMLEGDGALEVTASVGVATMPGAANDVQALIAAADAALYEAKRSGKNRVCVAPHDGAGAGAEVAGTEADPAQGPSPARRR